MLVRKPIVGFLSNPSSNTCSAGQVYIWDQNLVITVSADAQAGHGARSSARPSTGSVLNKNAPISFKWRHKGCDSASNHRPHDCLLNRLFQRISVKTSKLRVIGLCAGNSPGTGEFPTQMASNAENVSIWWRHHVLLKFLLLLMISDKCRWCHSYKNTIEILSKSPWVKIMLNNTYQIVSAAECVIVDTHFRSVYMTRWNTSFCNLVFTDDELSYSSFTGTDPLRNFMTVFTAFHKNSFQSSFRIYTDWSYLITQLLRQWIYSNHKIKTMHWI